MRLLRGATGRQRGAAHGRRRPGGQARRRTSASTHPRPRSPSGPGSVSTVAHAGIAHPVPLLLAAAEPPSLINEHHRRDERSRVPAALLSFADPAASPPRRRGGRSGRDCYEIRRSAWFCGVKIGVFHAVLCAAAHGVCAGLRRHRQATLVTTEPFAAAYRWSSSVGCTVVPVSPLLLPMPQLRRHSAERRHIPCYRGRRFSS